MHCGHIYKFLLPFYKALSKFKMHISFEHLEVTIEICILTHVYNSIGKSIFIVSILFN